jgi:hypothetical protein
MPSSSENKDSNNTTKGSKKDGKKDVKKEVKAPLPPPPTPQQGMSFFLSRLPFSSTFSYPFVKKS